MQQQQQQCALRQRDQEEKEKGKEKDQGRDQGGQGKELVKANMFFDKGLSSGYLKYDTFPYLMKFYLPKLLFGAVLFALKVVVLDMNFYKTTPVQAVQSWSPHHQV